MYKTIEEAFSTALATCGGSDVLSQIPIVFRRPPDQSLGDVAIPCFQPAKHLGQDVGDFGVLVSKAIIDDPSIEDALFINGFLNLKVNRELLFRSATTSPSAVAASVQNPERIMVEYLSPNTNKPLHLGHLRNGVLGVSVANILKAAGHVVVMAELVNDRGVHICKSMLAYQMFGDDTTPEGVGQKGDHFVGDYYVRFAQAAKTDPSLEQEAQAMLQKWEQNDPEVRRLWRMMTDWVLKGFQATATRFGFLFDRRYFESEIYLHGKDIVHEGLRDGIFQEDDKGNVVFDLPEEKFGTNKDGSTRVVTVLRSDGTGVYVTQDLGVAVQKADDYRLDRSIYVVAREQDAYFERLFAILTALGYPWAGGCHHLSYGMVDLPEGRMKSREGTVVDADDLIEDMAKLVADEICAKSESPLSPDDVDVRHRAEVIGMAAIKFHLLQFSPNTKITFDPKASLSFEGDTGPYCLYAVVRAKRLLKKAADQGIEITWPNFKELGNDEERALALDIIDLPNVIKRAAENYNPTLLAEHVLKIAKSFSQFYSKHRILSDDSEKLVRERLMLIQATKIALEYALGLLGIETIDNM